MSQGTGSPTALTSAPQVALAGVVTAAPGREAPTCSHPPFVRCVHEWSVVVPTSKTHGRSAVPVVPPVPLGRLVESSAGLLMSDAALLTDLCESTLSRLWDDPAWLDRISGRSLQALLGAVPRLGAYVLGYPLAQRRTQLADRLSDHGVTVDRTAFTALVREGGVSEQHLGTALRTTLAILTGDTGHAAAWLARCWGPEQTLALRHLLGSAEGPRVLTDPTALIAASRELTERTTSFHAILGRACLSYQLARVPDSQPPGRVREITRVTALPYRSTVLGWIITTNDIELSQQYCATVRANLLLAMTDDWALLTYTRDARLTPDFSLPLSVALRRTGVAVVREITAYNDAYLYYLTSTAIPALLHRDPTFGTRLPALKKALSDRLESCGDGASRNSCAALLKRLERGRLPEDMPSFTTIW